jgi:CheY-like chemotaxis protein
MREFLDILLAKEGYEVSLAASGEEACKMLGEQTLIFSSPISR